MTPAQLLMLHRVEVRRHDPVDTVGPVAEPTGTLEDLMAMKALG